VAASYIEALLPAPFNTGFPHGVQEWRWNNLLGDNSQAGGRGAAVTITYSFPTSAASHAGADGTGYAPLTDVEGGQQAAAEIILGLYQEVSKITFQEIVNDTGHDAQLLFGRNTNPNAPGYAYLPELLPEDLIPLDYGPGGDIWISRHANFDEGNIDVTPGTGGGWATLIHEIGHALGLKHPFDPSDGRPVLSDATDTNQFTVMSYSSADKGVLRTVTDTGSGFTTSWESVSPSTPMLYDIAAIQYLYGANMTTRTGNTTYAFEDPNEAFFKTIWDAGGTDTISVSNFSVGCTINLTAGKFSSIKLIPDAPVGADPGYAVGHIYDGTNNLAIAFGCTIENATGGSGADRLTGNAVGNTLVGNAGNDIIDGGKGNDKLDGGNGKDKLTGGDGNDTLTCQASDSKIDGGVGTADVLKFTGTLDLVAITDQARIINIEKIDMTGGIQTLKLGKADVLDISSTTNTLTIVGDAGDTVDLVGFTKGATSGGFVTWTAGTAIVKIEQEIVNVV
jgi:Ca2+-binding RTX toxin-like protein